MAKSYSNRYEAGKVLAEALHRYHQHPNTWVLALPRGGVPVAYEVARALQLPLDLFLVRKLGVPGQSELAMGAIAMGQVTVFNSDVLDQLHVSQEEINEVTRREHLELERRALAYRGNKPFPDLHHKTIILVDDGMATGATMRVAIKALRLMQVAHLIVAVPVAPPELVAALAETVDDIICPLQPDPFYAVGTWYDDFSQTEDEEVRRLMA